MIPPKPLRRQGGEEESEKEEEQEEAKDGAKRGRNKTERQNPLVRLCWIAS